MRKTPINLCLLALVSILVFTNCSHHRSDIAIADFEGSNYGDWLTEGEAFGSGPSNGVISDDISMEGFMGEGVAVSLNGGGKSVGKLISPAFTIKRKYINFMVGGVLTTEDISINLLIDNEVVRSEPDPEDKGRPLSSKTLKWFTWDVSEWEGKEAIIEVVDQKTEEWGSIAVDQIYQSDENQATVSFIHDAKRSIEFDKQYLNIPIKMGTGSHLMSIYLDNQKVREFDLELAEGEPDYWMFLDVTEWQGKSGVIQIEKIAEESTGLESMFVDNTVKGFENLYQEKDRPRFHYTSRRGWHNDPNGLVYYKGEYHLFYQHNPLGWPWGNMTWGHAISEDLVHWKEIAPAIYPDEQGTEFSGSGVIDWNNTTGFQQGEEKPMVIIYTAAGGTSRWSQDEPFTQCIAYSNDRGRTWTKYEGNPVLENITGGNRDPKVVWYEPGQIWVMALYLDQNTYGLYTSKDLKSWIAIQKVDIDQGAECPDFFEIPLDGDTMNKKWVLTAANGRFIAGSFDGKSFTPETESYPSEWGKNYYAVQSYSDIQDGRRIQFGWMAGSEFEGMPFNQQFSVARELTLRTTPEGIRLYGNPVAEIEKLHGKKYSWSDISIVKEENPLAAMRGELYHIIAEFDVGKSSTETFGFNLKGFDISYHIGSKMLTVNRPGVNETIEVKLLPENSRIRLELLLDRGSVEIFGNDGLVPMAFFYLSDEENKTLSLHCSNGALYLNSMDVYEMNSIWNN